MALEPSLQLALLIAPTMVILGWMTGQYISLEFDICELPGFKRGQGSALLMLRTMINSGNGTILSIRAHVFSVCRRQQIQLF